MQETYDAAIGGHKGLLHVGCGGPEGKAGEGRGGGGGDGDGGDGDGGGTMIRFVRERDGEAPLSFDASRLLSCEAKGRYRMIVTYEDAGGGGGGEGGSEGGGEGDGEKRLAIVRVYHTAVDRVIGAVMELAGLAGGDGEEDGGDGWGDGRRRGAPAEAGDAGHSTADATAAASGGAEPR